MKNKIAISIILTLLMIVSTFSVATGYETEICQDPGDEQCNDLEVAKKVWNGTGWADEATVEVGDTVTFKITITYEEVCGYELTDIVITDSIDPIGEVSYVLDFSGFEYQPSETGQPIVWNLTDDYGVILNHEDSVSVYFNMTITEGCEEILNVVEVNALEHCCGVPMQGSDSASVFVECDECEPGIEVEKTVWNGTAWGEHIDGLNIGDFVEFKIKVTYTDCGSGYEILNMIIEDELPCCLEYNETIDISTTGEMDDPKIETDGNEISWKWVFDRHIVLHDNDSITIILKAEFVNYCEGIGENWAFAEAWGCSGPTYVDEDFATVDCTPPDTEFDKSVFDGEAWVDEIETTTGETLRFKLSLVYYGEEEYYIIKFVDILPCILEYANNAVAYVTVDDEVIYSTSVEGDLQNDNKTVFFNFTYDENFTLSDGVEISVEFDALVIGTTGECCDCETEAINRGIVGVLVCGENEPVFIYEDEVLIHSQGNCPPSIPQLTGDNVGLVGDSLSFDVFTTDSDDDQVTYTFDWDGETEESSQYPEGIEQTFTHSWSAPGTYEVRVKATDEHGVESEWSYPLTVVISEPDTEGELVINSPGFFNIKTISASIENTGEEDLSDVDWDFTISKGGLLGGWEVNNSGTIETLEGETSESISTGPVTFKFGRATINITATCGELEETLTASAIVLGRFVLVM